MTSRRRYSRNPAMAKKRDTDQFQRMHQRAPAPRWDDDEPDLEASTYRDADHGPEPVPAWVITSDEARQFELGMLKTGKEADVHLVERRHGDHVNVLAAKRYRKLDERLFRNDARYRTGRRTGETRLDKAITKGNNAGMVFRAQQWVETEFDALCRLWAAGAPVPYPVQRLANEVMIELVGSETDVAPRLVNTRPTRREAADLWGQAVVALMTLTQHGVVHGDLSPYNALVHEGRLVLIDFPQAVDPLGHPEGLQLLERDVATMAGWFQRRGVDCDPADVMADLVGVLF